MGCDTQGVCDRDANAAGADVKAKDAVGVGHGGIIAGFGRQASDSVIGLPNQKAPNLEPEARREERCESREPN